jgi:hypothetical protein
MFKQIVSKLSLSPSATADLVFYSRRLKKESVTRTFSAIAAVLVVGLQFATILAPPTTSNAASPNDIVYGGFVSKSDLLNRYDASAELKALYTRFGISRADISASTIATVQSSDTTLKSIGRVRHWADDEVITTALGTYYGRVLHKWDTGASSSYQVLQGKRTSDGGYFAIMLRCGNIIYRNLPTPKPTPAPTPRPTPLPTPLPTPVKPTPVPTKTSVTCVELNGNVTAGEAPLAVDYTGSGTAIGQTVKDYIFNFGDNTTQTTSIPTTSHSYNTTGKFTATLLVRGSSGTLSPVVPACSFTVTVTSPPASFSKNKTALNVTQNLDATKQPAHAGDVIAYTLTTKNIGGTAESYSVIEHIEDIAEYADVVDAAGADVAENVMTWPGEVIQPGQTLTKTFTVKVKDPIPTTPIGLSDRYSYDLRMDNVYGVQVQVSIQPPAAKLVEGASATLPETGAGTSTLIVLFIACLSLFFYFRNRQLMNEIRILRNEYQGGPS